MKKNMELLSYPQSDFLLEVPFETMHAESKIWLNEIEFWSDEIAFFYKLLHKKKTKKGFPSKELAGAELELVRINSEKLDPLRQGVVSHENLLSSFLKSSSHMDTQVYRDLHHKLANDLRDCEVAIRSFKKKIFSVAEKL
jgi:hypothetical protein